MIKFFRQIRFQLLKEEKNRRYVKYAIGEIFLVVIGILIALQINNWNEKRKIDETENRYLQALKNEFSRNLDEIDRVIQVSSLCFQSVENLINMEDDLSGQDFITNLRSSVQFPPQFINAPGILNDLVNAGYLSKLKNDSLRIKLDKWFVLLKEVNEEETELWKHRTQIIDYIQENISFRNLIIETGDADNFFNRIEKRDHQDRYSDMLSDRYFDNLNIFYGIVLRSLSDNYYRQLKENILGILVELE